MRDMEVNEELINTTYIISNPCIRITEGSSWSKR